MHPYKEISQAVRKNGVLILAETSPMAQVLCYVVYKATTYYVILLIKDPGKWKSVRAEVNSAISESQNKDRD